MSNDLVKRLSLLADSIELGDKLRWGEDSAALREAKDRIEELEAKLAQQDDLVQAAVAAALREAADAVEDYCSDAPDLAGHGHSRAIRDVITAIRKGKKHEPLAFPNHAAHRR